MFGKVVDLLRLILDSETRRTVSVIAGHLRRSGKEWEKNIKTVRAKFQAGEGHKAVGFEEALLIGLEAFELPKETIEDCRVVLNELVMNAFEHGCSHASRGWVKIYATYSPWFVRLEVRDSGKGFELREALRRQDLSSGHGLQVVRRLCYRLYTNRRKGAIIGLIAAHASLSLSVKMENWRGQDIAVVNIETKREWSQLNEGWGAMSHALDQLESPRILVSYLDASWSTRRIREVAGIFGEVTKDGRRYALVVSRSTARSFDLKSLRGASVEVFVCAPESRVKDLSKVKDWLVDYGDCEAILRTMAPEQILSIRGCDAFSAKQDAIGGVHTPGLARLVYEDKTGSNTYLMKKEEIVIGRASEDCWVDVPLHTLPDISREHLRIRSGPNGLFYLKDVSAFGTTIDGHLVPASLERGDGGLRDLDRWVELPKKARIGLADCVFIDFEAVKP